MSEKPLIPARPVPLGEIIRMELDERHWSQKYLAERMGRPYQLVNGLIRGTKQITPDTALDLADAFDDTSAEFWMNLETNYRLALARKKRIEFRRQRSEAHITE